MRIEYVKDTRERHCSICKKRINKWEIIAKYEYVIDLFKNTRMWFVHVDCLIKKLGDAKEKIKSVHVDIDRFDPLLK